MTQPGRNARETVLPGNTGRGGTEAWGPPLWYSIHFVALGYGRRRLGGVKENDSFAAVTPENVQALAVSDDDESHAYIAFYESLAAVIPCKKCAAHYREELARNPVRHHLRDNMDLFAWTVSLHNAVNARLGKPEWSLDRALRHYSALLNGDPVPRAEEEGRGNMPHDAEGFFSAGAQKEGGVITDMRTQVGGRRAATWIALAVLIAAVLAGVIGGTVAFAGRRSKRA